MFTEWINEPKDYKKDEDQIIIIADKKTDFFNDPTSEFRIKSAPIMVKEINGDFTLTCKVTPFFNDVYDAGALMLYINDDNWVKFAFENTDAGYIAIASVVTNNYSDEVIGEEIRDASIWLRMTKRNNSMGLYYSLNNIDWKMFRLFRHNFDKDYKIFVGIEAQCPLGDVCKVIFEDINFDNKSIKDLRKGIA